MTSSTTAARVVRLLAFIAFLAALLATPPPARAVHIAAREPVTIHYFWGDGCPHCAALKPFLEELAKRPGVELARYEVWYDKDNRALFARVADAFGVEANGVPAVFIGNKVWIGETEEYRRRMAATVEAYLAGDEAYTDVAGDVIRGGEPSKQPEKPKPGGGGTTISLPLFGSHDVGADSLVWATALIAFVDGFNPCSLWVLTVLIAMILRTGSRARLTLVGGTYLTSAALVYGLFLVGLFSALSVIDYQWWIRAGVASFALAFAAINIKDYAWFGRGVSLTIPDRLKPRIARRTRTLAFENRGFPVVLGATAVIAAGVSLLELPCTVGFPVVWTNILADRGVGNAEYAFLLAIYLIVFLIDEIAILIAAIIAMRIGRLEERHGRVLKLVGGMLMAVLGVVMLVDPSLLQNVEGAAVAFAAAAALSAAAMLISATARRHSSARAPARPVRHKPAHRTR